jgi:hypothetical protein
MKTIVVLIPVDGLSDNPRQICEQIENSVVNEDISNEIKDFPADAETYPISEFMELCNDEEINLNNYFISYINLKK